MSTKLRVFTSLLALSLSATALAAPAAPKKAEPAKVQAEYGLSAMGFGGFDVDFPNIGIPGDVNSYSGGIGAVGGGGAEFRFHYDWGVELDFVYFQRKFTASSVGPIPVTTNFTLKMLQVPVMIRYHLPKYLSFGLGGYYGGYMSTVDFTTTVGGLSTNSSTTYTANNWKSYEWGVLGSVNFSVPVYRQLSVMADGRVVVALTDLDNFSNNNRYFTDLQFLFGLMLSL